jgi:hypothetical protein
MDPISAAIVAGGSLIGGKMSADASKSAAGTAAAASAPVPFSSPLYNTRFIGSGADRFLNSQLTPQGQQLAQGLLSDYQSIPLSDITQTGELYDRGTSLFGRAETAFDRAATPEASYDFIQRALGPQLEQQRLQQETRLANQGLLGATAGGLQTEALSRGQQQALLKGALEQQRFQGQLGQGLLSGSLNFTKQDLAERQFLSNLRSGALSGGIGLLAGAQDAGALTLRSGSPQGSAQAAAIGAQGQQQMAGNIAAGLQSIGLSLADMQEQPQQPTMTTLPSSTGTGSLLSTQNPQYLINR